MFHNGTVYPETSLNPNGADDVGSAYTWTSGASTSTITVGTGTQNFTTSTSLGLAANSWVGVFNSLALTNGMLCQVTSDTGTALDTSCTIAYGSGSFSSWIIIPWYYMDEQFVGWKANGTSATSLTIGTGTQTLTTGTGLNYAAGQAVVISVTGTPGEFMSGSVTSYNSSSGSLVANIVTTGGTCSACTSWTVSNSAHTMHIYDSAGNLVSTQIKAADPSDAGNPIYFGLGFGGDGTDAGNIFCFDGITAQWIGAPEYPIEP